MNEERNPAEVWPPSEFIWEELKARNWPPRQLGELSGLGTETILGILYQAHEVTEEKAVGLGQAFGTSADYWLNLQQAYYDGIKAHLD